ncbi:MAG: undecaprenyl-diphosphate phosphatase [Holosporaceae bacterium]|jgi:undecaprenyl-diphosphatase|nr:undecaprenyl-diphosphate phosphatase [Holosporaceae bacterium]
MTFLQAIFLGAVQGITEFLPVSSSAHVTIFSKLFGISHHEKVFDIFLNSGTLLAIIIFFRKQMWKLLLGSLDFIGNRKTTSRYFFVTILLSSLPTITVFGILEIVFNISINSEIILAGALILFGVVLYFCDQSQTHRKNISRKDSLLIGFVQPLSFIPGVSRLGICLSMMRYLKYSREESFRYCMMLSTIPVLGACFLQLTKIFTGEILVESWPIVVVGSFSAFISGWISLSLMTEFLKSHTLLAIIIYRILLGTHIFLLKLI